MVMMAASEKYKYAPLQMTDLGAGGGAETVVTKTYYFSDSCVQNEPQPLAVESQETYCEDAEVDSHERSKEEEKRTKVMLTNAKGLSTLLRRRMMRAKKSRGAKVENGMYTISGEHVEERPATGTQALDTLMELTQQVSTTQ